MRKPKYALSDATTMTVVAFETGKRNIAAEATGSDPAKVAKSIVDKLTAPDSEKRSLRATVRKAMTDLATGTIPGLTDCQIEHKGRRVRFRAAA